MQRRSLLKVLASSALVGSGVPLGRAQATGVVRLVVPFSAGTTADRLARSLAERLRDKLGRQFIVDNRVGAGGILGVTSVANAPADSPTLLLTTASPLVIAPFIDRNVTYDVQRDFQPVALVGATGLLLVARREFPANSLSDLIRLLKNNPGKYTYASSGNGSYAHVSMELFKQMVGVNVTHVPYKTTSQAETDVMGGQVDLMFDALSSAGEYVKGKRMRAYGISSRRADPLAPGIEPIGNQGIGSLADFDVVGWTGVFAPRRAPAQEVAILQRAIRDLVSDPAFRADMVQRGQALVEPAEVTEIGRYVRSDLARWKSLIRSANITAG